MARATTDRTTGCDDACRVVEPKTIGTMRTVAPVSCPVATTVGLMLLKRFAYTTEGVGDRSFASSRSSLVVLSFR